MLRQAKTWAKNTVPVGMQRALRLLATEVNMLHLHRTSVRRARSLAPRRDLKLNVGCGPNHRPGWVNIDLFDKADLQLDMREKLPLSDNCASIVYSEHFFEHLQFPRDARVFLAESLRVLQPGGVFSVGVPDTEWAIDAYVNGNEEYYRMAQKEWHPKWCDTPMHSLNFHFRQAGEHEYAYDFETMKSVLAEVGFVGIARRSFNPEIDSEKRREGTLYVDAYKPGVVNPSLVQSVEGTGRVVAERERELIARRVINPS